MHTAILVLEDCFSTTIRQAVLAEKCLDAALEAWKDPENDGVVISIMSDIGEPLWFFNPALVYGVMQ